MGGIPETEKDDGRKKALSPWTAYGIYGAAGVQLAASVIGGVLFGDIADKRLGSTPWLLVAGTSLGFVGGLINLVRIVGRYEKRRNGRRQKP